MTQFGVNFNGRTIVHPGAYGHIDFSSMVVTSDGTQNIPIVLGQADAGESGVLKWFTGLDDAREYLRGGELLSALELMFSPMPGGGGGASLVGVIIVNSTTKATATVGGHAFSSLEFGEGGNRITVKNENGTVSGSKKLTVSRWDTNAVEIFDNLGAVIILKYEGTQAYAEVNVTVTTGKATRLQTAIGADNLSATVDLDIDLTNPQYATIEGVVKHINSIADYTATYVHSTNQTMKSELLDAATDVSIKSGAHLLSVKGNTEHRVNKDSFLVSVTVTTPIANFATTYLAGGSKGSVPASWATHLDTVKKHFSDVLVILSGSETIHAEAVAHVGQMETRKQRQILFTGGLAGETTQKAVQRASTLNNSRAVLAYPGIFHKSVDNGKTVLPPYMTAAMIAGRVCGVSPSEPVTFDYFNLIGLEVDLVAGDPAINDLITSGVCTLERVFNGGIRLVQGITTYISSNNTVLREISVRRGADKLDEKVTRALEDTFIGNKNLLSTDTAIKTKVLDVLSDELRLGNIANYAEDVMVRSVGTVVHVDYQVAPAEPINFILVTSHFVPSSAILNNG